MCHLFIKHFNVIVTSKDRNLKKTGTAISYFNLISGYGTHISYSYQILCAHKINERPTNTNEKCSQNILI